jgi:UDP-N-acetylmuramyl tripeptide synthase
MMVTPTEVLPSRALRTAPTWRIRLASRSRGCLEPSTSTRHVHTELDRVAAMSRAIEEAANGDVVLITGRGHAGHLVLR